jgi:hypothetical protein
MAGFVAGLAAGASLAAGLAMARGAAFPAGRAGALLRAIGFFAPVFFATRAALLTARRPGLVDFAMMMSLLSHATKHARPRPATRPFG